ncbi:dienelactone hydrolase family protein [Microlunatus elymi]|uniref:Dienelactone hydrolase family protein n=1 Tax=Microlunatus elymi TaxID=2596828 RepID=A0A516Q3Y0_9ACTN|nr:dienelactone hydrolase family protein [Microlunatus elymi]QDP97921.1 dienelactone hydrolase family protein [Microlunatus elymi]
MMAGIDSYVATPSGPIKGGLVLIHEIWGLSDHIKQVADRFAGEGYLTYAPDILTHAGVTPKAGEELQRLLASPDPETRQAAQPLMRERTAPAHDPAYAQWAVPALREVVDDLQRRPAIDARIGVVGFCFGGSYTFALAAADERILAAVPFYGSPPDLDQVPRISCPVLGIYGSQDERLMESLPAVRGKMAEAGVDFTVKIYDGAQHAFFNETGNRYDAEAAAHAWQLALDFLDRHLAA